MKKAGGDEDACVYARRSATDVCPSEWTNNWDEQRVNGNFLGVQERAQPKAQAHHH